MKVKILLMNLIALLLKNTHPERAKDRNKKQIDPNRGPTSSKP